MNRQHPRYRLRLAYFFACWTCFLIGPLSGWTQGTAAESPGITLECQGCTPEPAPVRMLPGRKVQLYGPPGTAAIRGEVVKGGDTITLDLQGKIRKVPADQVTAIAVPRPLLWLKILGLHAAYLPYLLIAAIVLIIGGAGPILTTLVLVLPYALVFAILLATRFRTYTIGPWKIRRPQP